MINLIIIGPPGSGKGTQAALVAKKYHLYHLITGDLMRDFKKGASPLAQKAKAMMDAGELVPDRIVRKILEQKLVKILPQKGIIFDAYPRTTEQLAGMEYLYQKFKLPLPWLVYLNCSEDEVTQRLLLRSREDDKPRVIRERLKEFNKETEPLIKYFQDKNRLISIDGNPPIETVYADLINKLSRILA